VYQSPGKLFNFGVLCRRRNARTTRSWLSPPSRTVASEPACWPGKVEVALRPWTRCRGNWLSATSTRKSSSQSSVAEATIAISCGWARPDTINWRAQRSDSITSCLGVAQTTELWLGVSFDFKTGRIAEPWVQFKCSLSVSIECHATDVLPAKERNSLRQQGATKTNPRTVTDPNAEPAFLRFAIAAETSSRCNIIPHGS